MIRSRVSWRHRSTRVVGVEFTDSGAHPERPDQGPEDDTTATEPLPDRAQARPPFSLAYRLYNV